MYHRKELYNLTDVFQSGSTTKSMPSSHSVLSLRVWPCSTKVMDVSKSVSTMCVIPSVQFTPLHFSHRQYTYIFSMSDVSQSGSTMYFIPSVQFTSHFSLSIPTYSQCLMFPSPVVQYTLYLLFISRLISLTDSIPTYSLCLMFPSPLVQCTSYPPFSSRLLIFLTDSIPTYSQRLMFPSTVVQCTSYALFT